MFCINKSAQLFWPINVFGYSYYTVSEICCDAFSLIDWLIVVGIACKYNQIH